MSIIPLTNIIMLSKDLLKDWAFPDAVRRLQQTSDDTTSGDGHDFSVLGLYISGVVLIFVIAVIGWFKMFRICCASKESVDDVNTPELSEEKAVTKTPKSTLAERKQAILKLFETLQVTMVSNDIPVIARP
jgi:hypothetical protein